MPVHDYTRMFERMLAHPNIKLMLSTVGAVRAGRGLAGPGGD
jgi:UDP-galactopyranose mutase